MKREFLKGLELSDEVIDSIMAEHGKSVERFKGEAETLNATVTDLQTRLEEANGQIEAFREMDVEGIQKAAEEWKTKAEAAEKNAEARIREMEHDSILREKLGVYQYTSEYAKQGVFDAIKAKGLSVENGTLLGFDDALKSVREESADAFLAEEGPMPNFTKGMGTPGGDKDEDAAIRAIMGLPKEK